VPLCSINPIYGNCSYCRTTVQCIRLLCSIRSNIRSILCSYCSPTSSMSIQFRNHSWLASGYSHKQSRQRYLWTRTNTVQFKMTGWGVTTCIHFVLFQIVHGLMLGCVLHPLSYTFMSKLDYDHQFDWSFLSNWFMLIATDNVMQHRHHLSSYLCKL
jgi:hypothetical protein